MRILATKSIAVAGRFIRTYPVEGFLIAYDSSSGEIKNLPTQVLTAPISKGKPGAKSD
jgi:hypothetical protein